MAHPFNPRTEFQPVLWFVPFHGEFALPFLHPTPRTLRYYVRTYPLTWIIA